MKEDNLKLNREDILIDNNTNMRLNLIDLNLIGGDKCNFKFINILEGINKITYEVKKNVCRNLELNNILVLDKDIILKFFKNKSLYYKDENKLINTEILDELGQFNPDIEKVDNLVLLFNKKTMMMIYMNSLQEYLVDNKIKQNNIPQISFEMD